MRKIMLFAMTVSMPAAALAQLTIARPGPIQAIGPKQDDPLTCPADGGGATGTPGGIESIGPKQDDPRTADASPGGKGVPIIVQGGRSPIVVQGGIEAIGPKQDDPRSPAGVLARPGDDEDPHASSGSGDGVLAIGPKQDDPRSPVAVLARPGDDEDPQALKAIQGKCGKAAISR